MDTFIFGETSKRMDRLAIGFKTTHLSTICSDINSTLAEIDAELQIFERTLSIITNLWSIVKRLQSGLSVCAKLGNYADANDQEFTRKLFRFVKTLECDTTDEYDEYDEYDGYNGYDNYDEHHGSDDFSIYDSYHDEYYGHGAYYGSDEFECRKKKGNSKAKRAIQQQIVTQREVDVETLRVDEQIRSLSYLYNGLRTYGDFTFKLIHLEGSGIILREILSYLGNDRNCSSTGEINRTTQFIMVAKSFLKSLCSPNRLGSLPKVPTKRPVTLQVIRSTVAKKIA